MPPIQVSKPGTDLRTASGTDITLNTLQPFAKIDSTKPDSFQLINILFLHEPPNPDGSTTFYQRTLVHHFAHSYKYVPSTWFLTSVDAMASAKGSEGVILAGGGDFPGFSSAMFMVEVDATNVTFYIDKYYDTRVFDLGVPTILGDTLTVRSYIFVNDLSGQDMPSQA